MKSRTTKSKQEKNCLSLNRHKKEHLYFDETISSANTGEPIFGKFTRPVGSYRRGYKKPVEG